jgi:predicted nucleic acid-binding protein
MDARVVDASVVAALVFGEPGSEEAERLLGDRVLIAPFLMRYELAQVAVKKASRHPGKKRLILGALALAYSLDIQWVEVDFEAVTALALEEGLTAYDACYLFVSKSLGIPLVTFDKRLKKSSS